MCGDRGVTHSRTMWPPREHSWHKQLSDANQTLSSLSFRCKHARRHQVLVAGTTARPFRYLKT